MKKTLAVILLFFMTICSYSQAKHLSVLGIPITGNITTFQQKLQAKNYRVDTKKIRNFQLVKGRLKEDSLGMIVL